MRSMELLPTAALIVAWSGCATCVAAADGELFSSFRVPDGGSLEVLDSGFEVGMDVGFGGPDSGVRVDGGVFPTLDAEAFACSTVRDCADLPPASDVLACQQAGLESSYSCVDGECIWVCNGGRTCMIDYANGCRRCVGDSTARCANNVCRYHPPEDLPMRVSEATCASFPGLEGPLLDARVFVVADLSQDLCAHTVVIRGGEVFGDFYEIDNTSPAQFTGIFGDGVQCTGVSSFHVSWSDLIWSCPGCQFVIRWQF